MMRHYTYPSPIIAERIQKVFDEYKITDNHAAKILQCDRKTIIKYRHAYTHPSVKFIRWLCSTYKVDANWLLQIDDCDGGFD